MEKTESANARPFLLKQGVEITCIAAAIKSGETDNGWGTEPHKFHDDDEYLKKYTNARQHAHSPGW